MNARKMYLEQQKVFGYTEGFDILPIDYKLARIFSYLLSLNLPANGYLKRQSVSMEQIKKEAAKFYEKYFDLHDIYCCSESLSTLLPKGGEINDEFLSQLTAARVTKSPFDLPITSTFGHAMVGETRKNVLLTSDLEFSKKLGVYFNGISLGNNLVDLSIATYIHEIAHVQTESVIGYARNLHNKEVISIFLEKIAASELDKKGNLLKISEKYRLRALFDYLCILANQEKIDFISLLTSSIYIESTLKAEKLFDMYQRCVTKKDKLKIMQQIQYIFDGQMTVEELLENNGITYDNSCDLELIKRHL